MAHELQIRTRGDGHRIVAGYDVDVILDGRPLEWTEVELILKPDRIITARLTLALSDLTVDADVLVALRALADGRTKVVVDGEPERKDEPT